MPALPNFIIIGGPKCGTTSLCSYIGEHPQIFMPQNELFYFTGTEKRTWEDYLKNFDGAEGYPVVGEQTATYLKTKGSAALIHEKLGHPKLLAIFRNPVDRAFSDFYYIQSLGRAKHAESFDDYITKPGPKWYVKPGLYYQQLQEYFAYYPREKFFLCLFDDLRNDPATLYRNICRFLEVDETFQPDFAKAKNVTTILPSEGFLGAAVRTVRRLGLNRIARKQLEAVREPLRQKLAKKPEPMKPETRAYLIDYYRDDVTRLQDLLQRDLTHWLR